MTEKQELAVGTPIWIDLQTSDLEGAKNFYAELFGWEVDPVPDPQAGGYTFFRKNGKLAAGGGPTQGPDQPSAWTMYVRTDDADETARKVQEAGGQVAAGPFAVMDAGRMAVFIDPAGAFFAAWEPQNHRGAEAYNETNTFNWNELNTRDIEGAKPFYKQVFGWDEKTSDFPGGAYTEWQLGGRSIGGGMQMGEQFPAEVPPHWLTYFGVDDINATVDKVKSLGGNVLVPPMKIEPGTFAVVTDPQGAAFAVIEVNQ